MILRERRQPQAMSRFLPVITADLAVEVIADAERRAVLEIANLAEDGNAGETILERLPGADDVNLAAAVTDEAAALDALSLAARVSPDNGARVLRAGLLDPAVTKVVATTIARHDLGGQLRRAADRLAPGQRGALGL